MAKVEPRAQEKRSLSEQIADTETRILERRQLIATRRTLLTQGIRQKVTSPAVLLLAGGIGFIVGDLTRSEKRAALLEGESSATLSPFMQAAGNIMEMVRPLFLAEVGKLLQTISSVASVQVADHLSRFFLKPDDPSQDV